MSASSLTQTWQVGPRRGSLSNAGSHEETDSTQSTIAPRFLFILHSREGTPIRSLELGFGSHSFFFTDERDLSYRIGKHRDAEFEINIHMGGAFYVDISGVRLSTVNGRPFAWARLRAGDEIRCRSERIVLKHASPAIGDETIVIYEAGTPALAQGVADDSDLSPPDERLRESVSQNRVAFQYSKWLLILIGSLTMSGLAAFIGYNMARAQREKMQVFTTEPNAPVLASEDSFAESVARSSERKTTFSKEDFESALDLFRNGNTLLACEKFGAASRSAFPTNLWSQKAELFVKRRCR